MNICRLRVELRKGGTQEDLMKAYRRQYDQSKLKAEITEKSPMSKKCVYEKPSDKKRRKLKQRIYQQELDRRELLGLNRTPRKNKNGTKNQKY